MLLLYSELSSCFVLVLYFRSQHLVLCSHKMLLEVKSISAFFNSLLCTVFLVCAVFQIPCFDVVSACCIVQCLSHHCFDEACLPIHIHLLLCWWCHTLYIHRVFLLELDIKTFLCIVSKRSYRSYRREDDVPLEYKRVDF